MNTEELNMTTQDLIKHLRQLMPLGPQITTLVNVAAGRLEELQRVSDEARAEVERLKAELHEARIENSGQAAQLERTRPDPSRLEEALRLLNWARICIYETEIEYGPFLTFEDIERLPKAYRLRANKDFGRALAEFYEKCEAPL
jgi:predicted nuclease with TOPRIM domain